MSDLRTGPSGSSFIVSAAVLGVGILLAALIFGAFFYATRARESTIQVTGSATEQFTSDRAKWRLTLSRRASIDALGTGYAQLHGDLGAVLDYLHQAGIDTAEVSVQPVNANQIWGPDGLQEGYNLVQSLYVISDRLDAIERVALNPGAMLRSGVALEGSYIEYYYSGIDELKHSLLAAATQDARRRAEEIAGGEEGRSIGSLITGRAGVFQITEPYSTEVSAGGIYSTSTRDKEISVTVHATFEAD